MHLHKPIKAFYFLLAFGALCINSLAQTPKAVSSKVKGSTLGSALFSTDSILNITLSGDYLALFKDRAEVPPDYAISLSYMDANQKLVTIETKLKTRGHFRREAGNCAYPPLLIQFPKTKKNEAGIFSNQRKLKLVMPCRGDEYVVKEWLAYKIYNLVTPLSFKARLVRVTLVDELKKKNTGPLYGILLEDEHDMAARNNLLAINRKLQPWQTDEAAFLNMAVFQFLVANTDWSVQYQQNIKLLAANQNATPVAVPYDFDHAGIVNAPYAKPFEALQMTSVTERRYRGYCITSLKKFDTVINLYNQLKSAIISLYNNCDQLSARTVKQTLRFIEDFYTIINNKKKWHTYFSYPCDKNGTGNVVIKGLKK